VLLLCLLFKLIHLISWFALVLVRCSLLKLLLPLARHCCSSYSMMLLLLLFDIATPFVQRYYSLFDVTFPCSTLSLFLLDITIVPCLMLRMFFIQRFYCSCLTLLLFLFDVVDVFYSTLLLLLLNVTLLARHYYSSCSMVLFLCSFVFMRVAQVPFCYAHDVVVPCSLSNDVALVPLISYWYFPPLSFLQVWEELSKFKFFWLDSEDEIFFFNLCLLMNLFNHPNFFWEVLVDNVFICCVQESFGHYTFSYAHCISLLHIALCFLSTLHLFFFFFKVTCKCLG